MIFERYETDFRMKADGSGERIVHVVLKIQSQGAAQQFSVLSLAYAAATETPHITMVCVHKPDGTTVETPPDSAMDITAQVSRDAPLYSDLKEKHIAVRSLGVGDTLEYEFHTSIDKPETPGQFWGATHFTEPGSVVVLSEVLTLEVPNDKYVQIWSPNHKPVTTKTASTTTYSWQVPQLIAAPKTNTDGDAGDGDSVDPPKDPDEDAEGRKLPSVAWTTFRNWAEVGDWYRSMAQARTAPTDELRRRADEITREAKSPDEQVRALYAYVSSKVHYIGIDFGIGRYQPHPATEVLNNLYGDCKDKDTLLEALLKAKGFAPSPVLIGAGIAPLPDVPTPAVFNHVITAVDLPDGRVFLDSTPEVAPYQYLSPTIRDQKALLVPSSGSASLVTTPALPPYRFSERMEATATLDSEGKLTSKISATYRDDSEVMIRAIARNFGPGQSDKASQVVSAALGFGGTTSNAKFEHVDDISAPLTMAYDYSRHPFGDWDNHRIVPLFPLLVLPQIDEKASAPRQDIELGAPRRMVAITHIHLPENFHTDLPDPTHIKTDFATFDKTYRFDGDEITAERTVVILKEKVNKDDWKQYQKFTKDASLSLEAWIQLFPPSKPIAIVPQAVQSQASPPVTILKDSKGSVQILRDLPVKQQPPAAAAKPDPADENASTDDLMNKARNQLQSGDFVAANTVLEIVKKRNPQQQYLWALLGAVALRRQNYDEAKSDFETELKNHPENPQAVGYLANLEKLHGDAAGAQKTLANYLAKHPDEVQLSRQLASLQVKGEDYNGALTTLQAAAERHPDEVSLRVQLADVLVRLHRNDEAAAAAKSVLEDATDPGIMNDAAYILSQTHLDLAYAESKSRQSVSQLEDKSAAISTAEANRNAFASANQLIAAWDTLGWILLEEGKYDEARPFIEAAWRDSLRAEIGDHLGQVFEELGKKDEAARAYRLADAAVKSDTPAEVRQHIKDGFTRLESSGAKPGPKNGAEQLQDSRTYKLQKTSGASGWGTFRLQLTADGVGALQQMTGDSRIAAVSQAIKSTTFAELIPPGSKAHLLRSAVVSCSNTSGCELVLVPDGGLQTEMQ